jgi:hypothetical protein
MSEHWDAGNALVFSSLHITAQAIQLLMFKGSIPVRPGFARQLVAVPLLLLLLVPRLR